MSTPLRPFLFSLVLVLAFGLTGCDSGEDDGLNGDGPDGEDPVTGLCADLDANDDDRVTEEEFSSGFFDLFDADDDGLLTEGEFVSVDDYSTVFPSWENLFDTFDTDGDGSLTEAEFEAAYSGPFPGGANTFSIIDSDDSGFLNADECGFFEV